MSADGGVTLPWMVPRFWAEAPATDTKMKTAVINNRAPLCRWPAINCSNGDCHGLVTHGSHLLQRKSFGNRRGKNSSAARVIDDRFCKLLRFTSRLLRYDTQDSKRVRSQILALSDCHCFVRGLCSSTNRFSLRTRQIRSANFNKPRHFDSHYRSRIKNAQALTVRAKHSNQL